MALKRRLSEIKKDVPTQKEVMVFGAGKAYYGRAEIYPSGEWNLDDKGTVKVSCEERLPLRKKVKLSWTMEDASALVPTKYPDVKNRCHLDTDGLLDYALANPVWVAFLEDPRKKEKAVVLRIAQAREGWNVVILHDNEIQTWYTSVKPELFTYDGDKYDAEKHGGHPIKTVNTIIFGKLSGAKRVVVLDAATLASSRLLANKERTIVVPNPSGTAPIDGVTVKPMALEALLLEERVKGHMRTDFYLDFTKEWKYVLLLIRLALERTAYAGQTIGVTMAGRHDTDVKLEKRPTEIAQALSKGIWTVQVLHQEAYTNAHSRMMFFVLRVTD